MKVPATEAPTDQTDRGGLETDSTSAMPWLRPNGILLHIGPRKTATTALQTALEIRRPELLDAGITYPGDTRDHCDAVGRLLRGNDKLWDSVIGACQERADRAVVSAETFEQAKPEQVERIVADLGIQNVQVMVTLRPLAKMLPSMWQQRIKIGQTIPADDWFERAVHQGRGAWCAYRYDRLVNRWASVVGPENVIVLVVPSGSHRGVMESFEQITGLPVGFLPTPRINRSLTREEIELFRLRNLALQERGAGEERRRYWNAPLMAVMDQRQPGSRERRISVPPSLVEDVATLQQQTVQGIQASGVTVFGDLQALLETQSQEVDEPDTSDTTEAELSGLVAADLIAAISERLRETYIQTQELKRELANTGDRPRVDDVSSLGLLREVTKRGKRRLRPSP